MPLTDYADKLPADIQDAFKAEIAGYVPAKELERHPEFQRALSKKHDESMEKWQKERLPAIVEEQVKQRTIKDPHTLEIEKLRDELKATKIEALMKERKAKAVAEFAKAGIDAEIATYLPLDGEENDFNTRLSEFTGKVTGLVESRLKAEKEKIFGSKTPQGGNVPTVDFGKMTDTQRMEYAKQGADHAQAVLSWQRMQRR